MVALTVHSNDFLNFLNLNTFDLISHFENMMLSEDNLKQFKITLQKIKFIVVYLFELIILQVAKANVKYILHPILEC
jgi:hypothetical protein